MTRLISLLFLPLCVYSQQNLPLSFEINQGQFNPHVKFLSRGNGYRLALQSDGAALSLHKQGTQPKLVQLHFSGSAATATVTGIDPLPGHSNYLIGKDPKAWHVGVPNYARVSYAGVYPGIDVTYYGNQRELEYDITVAPHADPRKIRLNFEGASNIELDNGDLVLDKQLRIHKPVVYQTHTIDARFVMVSDHEVGFQLGEYDPSRTLTIDPVISYSTYLGGTSFDAGKGIAVDSTGNAYVTGQTSSIDFPTLPPYQDAFGGGNNIFVTKLNPAGTQLIYSTTIGGSGDEYGNGIAVDSSGNAYVTGITNSKNFPIVGGFQPNPATSTNLNGTTSIFQQGFVLKLNPAGTALVYSSYLGGSGNDYGRAIAVDPAGNAYVTGNVYSFNFPVKNPIQAAKGDLSTFNADAFAVKINSAGNALVYATYIGGSGDDEGAGIAVDTAGNAYITGETISPDFPVIKPVQGSRAGNPNSAFYDAFVTKINPAGTAYVYSTYFGGSNADAANGIAVDVMGNAYITGYTFSRDFPVAPAQPVAGTAFVTKLSSDGSTVVYSRSFGGNGTDTATALAVDGAGNAYTTGYTNSTNFPSISAPETVASLLTAGLFSQAAFAIKINPAGTALVYATPFGGGSDLGYGIGLDSAGNAYLTGQTSSAVFPTVGSIQLNLGGGTDAFVAKLSDQAEPAPSILPGGVVNGATYTAPVAAGSIVSIFGANLAPAARIATTLPIPTTLFDTTVTFNGVAAPLFYVSNTQINAEVPFETPLGSVTVQVQRADMTAPATANVTVAPVSPGIFTQLQQGVTLGAILHSKDFSAVTSTSPAVSGESLSIFGTGLGALQQPVATGAIPPSPPPMTVAVPTVMIGGAPAAVSYSGLAARLSGVYQINVVMPTVTPVSGLTTVQLQAGGASSNTVSLFAR